MASRKALVLGAQGAADLIVAQLRSHGFDARVSGERLPAISDPGAVASLRRILEAFANESRGSQSPCVHPGVTVWAERAELATLGEELGLDIICPPPRQLALYANKLNLLAEAEIAGIPHLVVSFDPIYSVREIERLVFNQALARKPFPFVLKAVKGGGSFGLQVVHDVSDLERKIPLWLDQLRRNLGEVILFAERYLEGARHIVVPFVRFWDGRVRVFPMTDASLQSRFRKVVELCPATEISPQMTSQLEAWTKTFAQQTGYVGIGTLEYLVDDDRGFLVEGSARLNTGFHLWERVAGTSAVAWQLEALESRGADHLAPFEPKCLPATEWASGLLLRLYAEDSLLQLPQPGEVREVESKKQWHLGGQGSQISAELQLSVEAGGRILPSDYGMVGLLWVGGPDRKQTLKIARGVLDQLWIAGSIQTNERFLSELLAHPWVQEGIFHAGFVDEEFLPVVRPPIEIRMVFARVIVNLRADPVVAGLTARWSVGDQWLKVEEQLVASTTAEYPTWEGDPSHWEVEGMPGLSGRLRLEDGRGVRVCAYPMGPERWQVRVGQWVLPCRRVAVQQGARSARVPKLFALIQGRVHSIFYREGTVVPAHEPLVIVESLGTLVPHALPVDVRVIRWRKAAEDGVLAGEELAEFEIVTQN